MRQKFLFILMIVAITGILFVAYRHFRSTPERAVSGLLNELQHGDIRGAERHTTGSLGMDISSRRAKKLYKAMYATMQYVIVSSEVEESSAKVNLSVTMVDMETQITAASYRLLDQSLSGKSADQKKLYQLLTEQISGDNVPTITHSATISLVRDDKNRWKVENTGNDEFLLAITGGVGPF